MISKKKHESRFKAIDAKFDASVAKFIREEHRYFEMKNDMTISLNKYAIMVAFLTAFLSFIVLIVNYILRSNLALGVETIVQNQAELKLQAQLTLNAPQSKSDDGVLIHGISEQLQIDIEHENSKLLHQFKGMLDDRAQLKLIQESQDKIRETSSSSSSVPAPASKGNETIVRGLLVGVGVVVGLISYWLGNNYNQ